MVVGGRDIQGQMPPAEIQNFIAMRWRPNLRNHAFDWMGESYKPLIDSSHFLGRSSFDFPWHEMPPTNVSKQEKKVVLDVSVPGFTKDDLEVTIKGNVLTVKGDKPHHLEKTGVEYIVEEFSTDSFERKFKLSDDISADHMEAKCEHGVLHISFIDNKPEVHKRAHHVKVE